MIDTGIAGTLPDFRTSASDSTSRVVATVATNPYATTDNDSYGHGTHVAGIIAGNGFDSNGARAGIAPAARLIVLKVLDGSGRGRTENHAPERKGGHVGGSSQSRASHSRAAKKGWETRRRNGE